MNIGFIGTGNMGRAMIPNLVNAGHRVSVWNRSADGTQNLKDIHILTSPVEAFKNDIVITMLSNDAALRSVILESGALVSAAKGCVHAVMATISPELAEELEKLHQQAGIGYVSAPVFGVPAAAEKAQLNIVAAGAKEALARVQPVFDVLGQRTWHLGDDPRRANIAKIAGNMMITLAIESMAEAAALTESYGVSAADFLDIMTNTLFASPSYKRYGGFIGTNSYEPGFKLTLGLKDVNLALDAASAKKLTLPSLNIVKSNMTQAVGEGWGDKDWSILAKIARTSTGLSGHDSKEI